MVQMNCITDYGIKKRCWFTIDKTEWEMCLKNHMMSALMVGDRKTSQERKNPKASWKIWYPSKEEKEELKAREKKDGIHSNAGSSNSKRYKALYVLRKEEMRETRMRKIEIFKKRDVSCPSQLLDTE